jgi:hypothetical protein
MGVTRQPAAPASSKQRRFYALSLERTVAPATRPRMRNTTSASGSYLVWW